MEAPRKINRGLAWKPRCLIRKRSQVQPAQPAGAWVLAHPSSPTGRVVGGHGRTRDAPSAPSCRDMGHARIVRAIQASMLYYRDTSVPIIPMLPAVP